MQDQFPGSNALFCIRIRVIKHAIHNCSCALWYQREILFGNCQNEKQQKRNIENKKKIQKKVVHLDKKGNRSCFLTHDCVDALLVSPYSYFSRILGRSKTYAIFVKVTCTSACFYKKKWGREDRLQEMLHFSLKCQSILFRIDYKESTEVWIGFVMINYIELVFLFKSTKFWCDENIFFKKVFAMSQVSYQPRKEILNIENTFIFLKPECTGNEILNGNI